MNVKGLLKISTVVMLLGLIFLAPFQTYADIINTVDNEVSEILKESESEASGEPERGGSDESESEASDESERGGSDEPESEASDESERGGSDEPKTYNGIELEDEQYIGLELNDDSFDKQVWEEDSVEAIEMFNVITVIGDLGLINAINTAPTDGTLRIIQIDGNIPIFNHIEIPSGTNIELRNNTIFATRQISQWGSDRHFLINGQLTLTDGVRLNSTLLTGGGGVFVRSGGSFTMSGGEIMNSEAGSGGGVFVGSGGSFTMSGGIIYDNNAHWGGGVSVGSRGSFMMSGGEIRNNEAGSGGGVDAVGSFRMTGGEIRNNKASNSGGGVYCTTNESSHFRMEGGKISGNEARWNGGGVFVRSGFSFTMSGGEVSGNTAERGGGVDFFNNNVFQNFTMEDGKISGNEARSDGGGVYTQAPFTMRSGAISGNTARRGGGIFLGGNMAALVIDGGEITSNEADVVGGIYIQSVQRLNNTTITRNSYVADNKTTANLRMFNNLYNETHNINANGRINPLPWDGLDNSHVFNTVDMNTSSFQVVVRLKNNFEASDKTIFEEFSFDVTDLVEFSPQFWNENIAGKVPTRLGYQFTGWSFTPEGEIIDHTQLGNELILKDLNLYAQWESDQTYLNVSIPTALFFQSNHEDATQLISPTYTITNHSEKGVHVDIADFEATHDTGVDLIEELNVHSIGSAPTSTRLITSGSIETIPTNSRLLSLPGDTDGSFKFSGQTSISSQAENPSFNFVLGFEVAPQLSND